MVQHLKGGLKQTRNRENNSQRGRRENQVSITWKRRKEKVSRHTWQLMVSCGGVATTKHSGWVESVASETVIFIELERLEKRH